MAHQRKKKKPSANDDILNDQLFKSALETLQKPMDEDDKFGQYVAMELRGLRSDFFKRRLKSEIRKAVIRIVEEEEMQYTSSASNMSTPMQSPNYFVPQESNTPYPSYTILK